VTATSRILALFALLSLPLSVHANLEDENWIFHHANKQFEFKRLTHLRGSPLVSLDAIAHTFSLKLAYNPESFTLEIENPREKQKVTLQTHSRKVKGVFGEVEISRPPVFEGARLYVPIDFGDRVLRPLLSGVAPLPLPLASEVPQPVDVVIDPGHGGNDFGASFKGSKGEALYEKDVTLALALELRSELAGKGIAAALTRDRDLFLTLPERTHFTNQLKPKLFLSLHMNADPQPAGKSRGYEVYVLSLVSDDKDARRAVALENQMIPEDLSEGVEKALADLRASSNFEASLEWAKLLSKPLAKSLPAFGKPVKSGPFYVLYGTEMPALLLEAGFITNSSDASLLMDREKRQKLVAAIADTVNGKLNPAPQVQPSNKKGGP
jgi:N-acetylmuramoyl-L-alanine amidase